MATLQNFLEECAMFLQKFYFIEENVVKLTDLASELKKTRKEKAELFIDNSRLRTELVTKTGELEEKNKRLQTERVTL